MTSSSSDAPIRWGLTEGAAAVDALRQLAADLSAPPMEVGVAELAALWEFDAFRFTCPRPHDMEEFPTLSERLRGAVGVALYGQPQPRTATGWPRPHACDVLFADTLAEVVPGDPAKPLIVRGWINGDTLHAEIRIFGSAMGWRDEAAAAMLQALRAGIALRGGPRAMRVAMEPQAMVHRRSSFVEVPRGARSAWLRFRTPVVVRRGNVVQGAPAAVLAAAQGRVARMAAWQGCRLATDRSWFDRQLAAADIVTEGWHRVAWERFTRNQRSTPVPVEGYLGDLRVTGASRDLLLLLALARTCHIGSQAALGMGWFEMIFD